MNVTVFRVVRFVISLDSFLESGREAKLKVLDKRAAHSTIQKGPARVSFATGMAQVRRGAQEPRVTVALGGLSRFE
jgi:hypothetical protein